MQVIKLGGRTQGDPALADAVAAAWKAAVGALCIVHGGGDEISEMQRRLGLESRMHGGRRVTTEEDLHVVRMVLSGSANKRMVSDLSSAGLPAVGISGEDGSLIEASEMDRERYGFVGAPSRINGALLHALLDAGYLPVVSPVGKSSATGGALNINGDDAAAAIAAALGADDLLFVADVPGVRDEGGGTIPRLDTEAARTLVRDGVAQKGMAAKLEAAIVALDGGVGCVRIGNMDAVRDSTSGTRITASPDAIR